MGVWKHCFFLNSLFIPDKGEAWLRMNNFWSIATVRLQRGTYLLPTTQKKCWACFQRKQDVSISHRDVCDTVCFHPLCGCLLSILACCSFFFCKSLNIGFAELQSSCLCYCTKNRMKRWLACILYLCTSDTVLAGLFMPEYLCMQGQMAKRADGESDS